MRDGVQTTSRICPATELVADTEQGCRHDVPPEATWGSICMGIECQDCFRCPGDGRGNTSASVKAVAEAWLLANPEPVEEKKEVEE